MTAITGFYDYVLPHVPGCAPALALLEIRNALIDFMERARVQRHTLDAIDIVAGTHNYVLTPAVGYRTVDVLMAKYNGKEIVPAGDALLDAQIQDWRESTTTGVPEFYQLSDDLGTIYLYRYPADSLADGLVVEIAEAPTRTATEVNDYVFNRHAEDIAHGALHRLMAMPKKPWTNDGLAVWHGRMFNSAISAYGARADLGNTRAPKRSRSVYR